MTSSLIACSLSAPIRVSFGSGPKNPDSNRKISTASTTTNWWAPLFGLSSDPDYINTTTSEGNQRGPQDPVKDSGRPKSKFSPGCFTEAKAKQLRRKTMEGSSFHDAMYHSAIASRLASDASVWPEKYTDRSG